MRRFRTLRGRAIVAVFLFVIACETALPSTILVGGAVLQVVAANYIDDPNLIPAVTGLVGTLTTVALGASEQYLAYRRRQQEVAQLLAIEAEIAAEQQALLESESEPAPSWDRADEASAVAGSLPGEEAPGTAPGEAASPWGDRYSADPAIAVVAKGIPAAPEFMEPVLWKRAVDASGERAVPIADGDVLYDGIDDDRPADALRVSFRTGSAAWVYVVAVDAAGRVQPIHPPAFPDRTNPLPAGHEVVFPQDGGWYGLDRFTGIQHVYFVSSAERNEELERQLAWFASRGLPELPATVHTVSEVTRVEDAAVAGRGLTGVQTQVNGVIPPPREGSSEIGQIADSGDLVITRYFVHR